MEIADKIYLASKAAEKMWSWDDLYWSDDLYHEPNQAYDIWKYVNEYKDNGAKAFREKYKKFKLY